MGGIQTIVIGDFYQLPPVPNRWNKDAGDYAFTSPIWEILIPHRFVLKTIHRQSDKTFINVINETARGCPSVETTQLLKDLDNNRQRQLNLFATRYDAHLENIHQLLNLEGHMEVYQSTEGNNVSKKMRKSIDAPVQLCLKVNAPVILTVNLSQKLVNGLQGRVQKLDTDYVHIYFFDVKETHVIERHNFYIYDRKMKKNIFIVKQFPLLLSFALTMHKSQGMTLTSVCVNCQGAFDPGQVSVAIGRVQNTEQLTVTNFRPSLCPPHPPIINKYYGSQSTDFQDTLACCKKTCLVTAEEENVSLQDHENDDSDEDEDDDEEIDDGPMSDAAPRDRQILSFPSDHDFEYPEINCTFPSSLTPSGMRERLIYDDPFTPQQNEINANINMLPDEALLQWSQFIYGRMWAIANLRCKKEGDTRQITSAIHEYINIFSKTTEFRTSLKHLFGVHELCQSHLSIGIDAILRISDIYFSHTAQQQEQSTCTPHVLTVSGQAKVRYVAGMCVGRVLNSKSEYVCRNIHKATKKMEDNKQIVMVLKNHLYNSILIAKCETQYPETLQEIVHRQSKYGHLTIVDDNLLDIFIEFDRHIFPQLTSYWLHRERDALFTTILNDTLDSLITDCDIYIPVDITSSVLLPILSKYLKTCLKEMGVRLVEALDAKKKMAHRKQVLLEEPTTAPSCKKQKSNSPATSPEHQSVTIEPRPSSSKTQAASSSQTIPTSSSNEPATSSTIEAIPSTSTAEELQNEYDDVTQCVICHITEAQKPKLYWIECSVCEEWRHRRCDKRLKAQRAWLKARDGVYRCSKCSE